MRILSLCSGYGGLDLAVEAVTGGRLTAYAESAPAPAKVMAHRFPGTLNLGDIRQIKWADLIGEFEIVAAGFPCQNISNAGDRTGIDGEKSSVWSDVADCIGIVRPRLVFLENVASIRTRGLDRVAGDLAERGYDLRWVSVRASEAVGAAHPRHRWFGLARPAAHTCGA